MKCYAVTVACACGQPLVTEFREQESEPTDRESNAWCDDLRNRFVSEVKTGIMPRFCPTCSRKIHELVISVVGTVFLTVAEAEAQLDRDGQADDGTAAGIRRRFEEAAAAAAMKGPLQ